VNSVSWSPNSKYIVSYVENSVHVWEARTGNKTFTFGIDTYASPLVAWSPNGNSIAFYTEKTIHIWDLVERRQTFAYTEQSEKIDSLLWLTDGFHAISKLKDDYQNRIKFWNIVEDQGVICRAFSEGIHPICSPDGKYIATVVTSGNGEDGYVPGVIVWSTATGDEILDYSGRENGPEIMLEWSSDSRYTAFADGDFQVWDVTTLQQVISEDVKSSVYAVSWAPNGKYIAYADGDSGIQIWDIETRNMIYTYHGHTKKTLPIDKVSWSPDSRRIASIGCRDNTVHVWDATTGKNAVIYCQGQPCSEQEEILEHTVVWAPNGKCIASANNHWKSSGYRDHSVHIWDAFTGNILQRFCGHSDQLLALAWSPDAKYIASAGDDKTVQVWVASYF